MIAARGLSFHVGEGDDESDRSYSVGSTLEIDTCEPTASSIRIKSDAGRGAVEIVVARSASPMPSLRAVLPERVGGTLPPNVDPGPVPALPSPEKRADAAEATARRDGGAVPQRAEWRRRQRQRHRRRAHAASSAGVTGSSSSRRSRSPGDASSGSTSTRSSTTSRARRSSRVTAAKRPTHASTSASARASRHAPGVRRGARGRADHHHARRRGRCRRRFPAVWRQRGDASCGSQVPCARTSSRRRPSPSRSTRGSSARRPSSPTWSPAAATWSSPRRRAAPRVGWRCGFSSGRPSTPTSEARETAPP